MSLFLGLYSHSRALDPERIGALLAEFGRGRELRTFADSGFLLATINGSPPRFRRRFARPCRDIPSTPMNAKWLRSVETSSLF